MSTRYFNMHCTPNFWVIAYDPSSEVLQTEKKIREFQDLPEGWHYGDGHPLSYEVFNEALELHRFLLQLGFTKTDAFPGVEGDISITVYKQENYICVNINLDLTADIIVEINDVEVLDIENIALSEVRRYIMEVSVQIWGSSVSSTQNILMKQGVDFITQRLRKILETAEYQSSKESVLTILEEPFVSTFDNFTNLRLGGIGPFSGSSQRRYYLPDTA